LDQIVLTDKLNYIINNNNASTNIQNNMNMDTKSIYNNILNNNSDIKNVNFNKRITSKSITSMPKK
jgi:hypothetical protein